MNSSTYKLDKIDWQILEVLQSEGRISNHDLAERISLSPTPCGRRLKRLEKIGVIKGYCAKIDPSILGIGIDVLITVSLSRQTPDDIQRFVTAINELPEITECLLVAGNVDYILRVNVKDVAAMRDFVLNELKCIPCVVKTSTMLVLDSMKTDSIVSYQSIINSE